MTIARELFRLALPATLTSLLQTAVFVVDRVMLGRHGAAALAASHIAGHIEWAVFSVTTALTVGTLARVGMAHGAGDPARARAVEGGSIGLCAVVGVAVAAPLLVAMRGLGAVFPAASAEVIGQARGYLGWMLLATPAMLVAAAATASLQGRGDTRTPLAVAAVVNVVHVAQNRVLILGAFGLPAMGAPGAGISTSTTFVLEAVLLVGAMALRARRARGAGGPARPPDGAWRRELRAVVRIGWPAVVERALQQVGFLASAAIIGLLGDVAMAAHQAMISLEAVCFMTADGFGVAAAALVAQKTGARRPDDARRAALSATRAAAVALFGLGLAIALLRGPLVAGFTRDPSVAAVGLAVAPWLAIAQPFMAVGIVLAAGLRGAGATRLVLGISIGSALVVRVAACWFFGIALGWGLVGVWIGATVDWVVRFGAFGWIVAARGRKVFADAAR